jgi:hypothetical protein
MMKEITRSASLFSQRLLLRLVLLFFLDLKPKFATSPSVIHDSDIDFRANPDE